MSNNTILIMTAVETERQAVLRGLQHHPGFKVEIAGVGPVAAAVHTTLALAKNKYACVISAGIGGGFPPHAELEHIVIANAIILADLGAESPDGFIPIEKLGFGNATVLPNMEVSRQLVTSLSEVGLPVVHAPILTRSTVTGTKESADQLMQQHPEAAAEAMEGFGVAAAAVACGIPVIELRTISNMVGPRDRDSWRMKEALNQLTNASAILREVFK